VSVTEGSSIALTMTRTGGTGAEASVEVVVDASSTASTDDYRPLPAYGPVTFPVGASRGTNRLTTVDDRRIDPGETIVLVLEAPTGAALGSTIRKTVRIVDNDPAPRLRALHG
jgi:hypothetical protein